jgi:elongation factor P hydroxylase
MNCEKNALAEQLKTEKLIDVFNSLFLKTLNTKLVRGENEPLYVPQDDFNTHNRIVFAHGYFSSALHEISHWLVAGRERRKLIDYGYWYKPDGRSEKEQQAFEKVEIKPQAIEWILAKTCNHPFHFSADNLSANIAISDAFKSSVHAHVIEILNKGGGERMDQLLMALSDKFAQPPVKQSCFIK